MTSTRWYCYHDAVLHHIDVIRETPQFLVWRRSDGRRVMRWKKISRGQHWYPTKDAALSAALAYTGDQIKAAAEAWRHWKREDATVQAWINAVARQERRERELHLTILARLLQQLCDQSVDVGGRTLRFYSGVFL